MNEERKGKQKIRQPERNECGEGKAEPIQEQSRSDAHGVSRFWSNVPDMHGPRPFISSVTHTCFNGRIRSKNAVIFRCCHTIVNYSQP